MSDITDFTITMQGSSLLFFLLLSVGIAAIIFMYRRTIPPLPFRRKFILVVIRTIAIVFIIAMIFSPLFSISFERTEKPEFAVLIDTSESMDVRENGVSRSKVIREFFKSREYAELQQKCTLKHFIFDRKAAHVEPEIIDTATFTGTATDLSQAMKYALDNIDDNLMRGIMLFSDGNHNVGENPVRAAENLGVPVYTVGIGSAEQKKDVLISNLTAKEIVYSGNTVPINITIKNIGFETANASVTLKDNDKPVDTKIVQLPGNNRERSVAFNYDAVEPGIRRLEVEILPVEGELSTSNNRWEFYVKVLESRLLILLVSGQPNHDYKFIKRSLEAHDNFSMTGMVMREGGYYFGDTAVQSEQIGSYDLFILIDFPGSIGSDVLTNAIRDEIIINKKPVMYVRGKHLSEQRLLPVKEALNITGFTQIGNENEIYLQVQQHALDHPVFNVSDNPSENSARLKKLPPVFTGPDLPVPGPGSTNMCVVDPSRSAASVFTGNAPMVFISRIHERKTLFFNIYNLWRWKFMALRDPDIAGLFDRLIENSVRWLVNTEDSKVFNVSTNKDIYTSGEDIIFNAQVYTENYDPVDNAEVSVIIKKNEYIISRILRSAGDGMYEMRLEILEPGSYSFEGLAKRGEKIIGRDTENFVISEFNIELMNTSLDSIILAQIAAVSNGRYFSFATVNSMFDVVNSQPVTVNEHFDVFIWNKAWLLALIILLLCCEWFLRKRWGML